MRGLSEEEEGPVCDLIDAIDGVDDPREHIERDDSWSNVYTKLRAWKHASLSLNQLGHVANNLNSTLKKA